MTWTDCDYHRVRVRDELDRARSATSVCASRAHLALAALHNARIEPSAERVTLTVLARPHLS